LAKHAVCLGKTRNVYKILVRKPEGYGILEKSRQRLGNNIEIDLMECEMNLAGSV
jgi:hypothetical protein